MIYHYTYIDHVTKDDDNCPWSGRPVESGTVDESDPDADQDGVMCPDECPDSGIEREGPDQ